jgi:hypothetical protein
LESQQRDGAAGLEVVFFAIEDFQSIASLYGAVFEYITWMHGRPEIALSRWTPSIFPIRNYFSRQAEELR